MSFSPLFFTILTACLLCIDTANGLSIHLVTSPIITAFILSWPTAYLPQKIRGVIQFLIGLLVILVCLVDCYCQEFFASSITPLIISNIILSDARETIEFFTTFIGIQVFFRWRIVALLLMAIAFPFALYFLRKPIAVKKPVFLTGIVMLGICAIIEIPATYRYAQLFFQHRDYQKMEGLIFRHYHEEVPTPLHRSVFALYSLRLSSHTLEDIKQTTFAAQIDSCSYLSPHIVLVIGESYNKHHSTLYGYHLQTTPLQQKRKDNGELYVFSDVVSPWNITSNAILGILSLWEYGMKESLGEMPLSPMLFRRAGYSVNFFSNQFILRGFLKGTTNQAGHFFLADYEVSDSLFTFRNFKNCKFDTELVEQVNDYRKENSQQHYTLDIIHLIGQHFDYSERYPKPDNSLSMEDYDGKGIDIEDKLTLMQYDKATHYNDIVLDSILNLYQDDDAIVLFVADHGEEAYDDEPLHGRLFQEPTPSQARYEFEVPMWIWCSQSYRQNHPEVIQRIEDSVNKPFLSDGLSQVLLYLAGISCPWYDDTRNLLSPHYQSKQRIIGGSVDYDELMK